MIKKSPTNRNHRNVNVRPHIHKIIDHDNITTTKLHAKIIAITFHTHRERPTCIYYDSIIAINAVEHMNFNRRLICEFIYEQCDYYTIIVFSLMALPNQNKVDPRRAMKESSIKQVYFI